MQSLRNGCEVAKKRDLEDCNQKETNEILAQIIKVCEGLVGNDDKPEETTG